MSFINDILSSDEKSTENSVKKNKKESGKPIIFIPGITGSELFTIDEKYLSSQERKTGMITKENEEHAKRLWLPHGYDVEELNRDLNIKNPAYGLQEGDLRELPAFNRHLGPGAANAVLLKALLIKFPDRPIYQFSYDWRKSNTITSKKLDAFIKSIAKRGKVDIVAHSMGGLVTAHYLREHGGAVDKFISLCTPYEGAPLAYNRMIVGNIFGGAADVVLEKLYGIDKDVIQDYDGLVELYPTTKMLEAYPYQRVTDEDAFAKIISRRHRKYEKILAKLHKAGASESIAPSEVQKKMRSYLGMLRFERFLSKARQYRSRKSLSENVALIDRPRTMFIVGRGIDTQVSGYYTKDEKGQTTLKDIQTREGDGQVPLYSACMGHRLEEMPHELRKKFKVIKGTHMGMLVDLRAIDVMCKFLSE